MRKKFNWLEKTKILKKIKLARNITHRQIPNEDIAGSDNLYVKLKEITDKAELIYNDAKIKSYKSLYALQEMRECEKQLDELLWQLKKVHCNEISKDSKQTKL